MLDSASFSSFSIARITPRDRDDEGMLVEITSQNHGFVVVPASVGSKAKKTYHNLNDSTSEGMQMPLTMSVQYHPEASPGPHDTEYLFLQFVEIMKKGKRKTT